MCGICGIVLSSDRPVSRSALERACCEMRHRGPDHTGIWMDHRAGAPVGLAAVRLAVLDPSPVANQPMQDPTGRFHLVFNGEMYNYRELRRELAAAGDRFVTEGDAEVVLAACVRWGVDSLTRFNGMWSLAFFDSNTRSGFLSRDRFGIKPLFYAADRDGLRFASELRSLRALSGRDLAIDRAAVLQHLRYGFIAHPTTIFTDVHRLAPGRYLRFDSRGIQTQESYLQLDGPRAGAWGSECRSSNEALRSRPVDYTDVCGRVRRTLADAVAIRRVSDVPLGAFLSGGLDSSIVVLHLAAATGHPVKTFSVGYAGQRRYDETAFARLVGERFGTEHHELILTQRDILAAIPKVLDHLGEPVGDSSLVPTALLSQFCRQHVTVALSGDGGDELFGGYWRYVAHDALATYQRLPGFLRRRFIEPTMRLLASSKSSSLGDRVRQFRKLVAGSAANSDALTRHIAWSRIVSSEAEALFLESAGALDCDRNVLERARLMAASMGEQEPINRILGFDLGHQLPADMLHKVDLASMMHSLEVRVPFLDSDVVALAASLPSNFKVDRGRRKCVLTDAYRGHLPDVVLERPKQGFEVPIGELLRGPLKEIYLDTVTRDVVESIGGLSYHGATRVFHDHLARRGEHADLLFALLSLCWWRRRLSTESI